MTDPLRTIIYVGVSTFNPENPEKGVDYRDSYETKAFKKDESKLLVIWILKEPIKFGPGVQKAILLHHGADFSMIPDTYTFGMVGYTEHPDRDTKKLILTLNTFVVGRFLIFEGMLLRDAKRSDKCIPRFVTHDAGAVVFNARSNELFGIHGGRQSDCFITEGTWGDRRMFMTKVISEEMKL